MSSENMKNTVFTADGGVKVGMDLTRVQQVLDLVKDLNLAEIDAVMSFSREVREGVLQQLETYQKNQPVHCEAKSETEIGPVS